MYRLKADMHIHSTYSDGEASPREIVVRAFEKGIDVIAITDHNTFRGAVKARDYARLIDEPPVIIIGNEVRTQYGDILVYCVEEANIPNTLPELIDRAHEENCIVVPAHPYDIFRMGVGDMIFQFRGWDAIEVWNASSNYGANRKAIKAARILGLPGIASSDAHILDYIGVAYTIIEARDRDPWEILKAITMGRVKPRFGYPPFKIVVKRYLWSLRRVLLGVKAASSQ